MGVKIDNHQGVKNAIGIISSIFDSDVGRTLITSFKLKDTICHQCRVYCFIIIVVIHIKHLAIQAVNLTFHYIVYL